MRLRLDFPQAPFKIPALALVRDESKCPAIALRGIHGRAKTAQQVRPRGVQQMGVVQSVTCSEAVDDV